MLRDVNAEYQVISRRYRPQKFTDVIGHEAVIRTLQNAIREKRLAHAYLFSGSRGTGKTTLARILARAINCLESKDQEPCNTCTSCKEILAGNSLDVIEIDGASNRGIDDIRKISESASYATATGGYRIYIIDEVHMLTKEAFNALLKTLEEPPPQVKFFFATTEPHKLPATIRSRCQKFELSRIPLKDIVVKLARVAKDLKRDIDEEALFIIATNAEGGLRDAESLLDQVFAFHDGKVTAADTAALLGSVSLDLFFKLDQAGKERKITAAFEIAQEVFEGGKNITHFVESLLEHFRNLLALQIAGPSAPYLSLTEDLKKRYAESAKLYTEEACLYILDLLIAAQEKFRFAPNPRASLEALLLTIIRSHSRISIESLTKRLIELEKGAPPPTAPPLPQPLTQAPKPKSSITIDPSPTFADLGKKAPPSPPPKPKQEEAPKAPAVASHAVANHAVANHAVANHAVASPERIDTILQFAAVELEGNIEKGK